MSFLSIPEASFTVHGARAARDAAMVRAGVDLTLFGLAEVYAQFDGALAAGGSAYAGKGGIRLAW
jgi:uncharacterized protein with beta-barrel porin domain